MFLALAAVERSAGTGYSSDAETKRRFLCLVYVEIIFFYFHSLLCTLNAMYNIPLTYSHAHNDITIVFVRTIKCSWYEIARFYANNHGNVLRFVFVIIFLRTHNPLHLFFASLPFYYYYQGVSRYQVWAAYALSSSVAHIIMNVCMWMCVGRNITISTILFFIKPYSVHATRCSVYTTEKKSQINFV